MKRKPEYATPQKIMGEAVAKLKGMQQEIYYLTIRDGKSVAEVSEVLCLTVELVEAYKARAVKEVEAYCKRAMAKGRL